jgi:hypothetical protein
VTFPQDRHVRVQVSTDANTWFARVFGASFGQVRVGASAVARVMTSGTAACIKPFGIPDGLYDDANGDSLLIWESRSGKGPQNNEFDEDEEGAYEAFTLVGDTDSSPGVGRDIYEMLATNYCPEGGIQMGADLPAKPGNNTLGNVRQGLSTLSDSTSIDRDHLWSEDFNIYDFDGDPIVAIIPTYEPPAPATGTGTVKVTGFLKVVIDPNFVTCQNQGNRHPDCNDEDARGQRQQVWARVYPATGLTDTCVGAGCSETNFVLQLIQ